ncbi:MAG: toll/interleukin-1 receptor domain-containing protein, partial [Bacteroidota bacterium]|nr:toll/interleukin-1 receptor domain-containing protein [Bacteroidota bacterium]
MRKTIFISHAAPEDNDFTRWLSLQLIGLGYTVWSDVINLKGGEDWWKFIEKEIREETIKFLFILSTASNYKDGTLKELAVAQKVKKQLADDQFIIPLHIDKALSYDDVNIELNRFNSINFKQS